MKTVMTVASGALGACAALCFLLAWLNWRIGQRFLVRHCLFSGVVCLWAGLVIEWSG